MILASVQLVSFFITALRNPGLPKLSYENQIYISETKNMRRCKDCNLLIDTEKKTFHCYDCNVCIEGKE